MRAILNRKNLSYLLLSLFLFVALFNPLFKKYDYGGGFPIVLLFAVMLFVLAILEYKKSREKSEAEGFFLLIFIAAVVVSFLLSQTRNIGFSEVLAFVSIVPFYFLFAYQKLDFIEKFLKVVVSLTVLAVVWGYVLYLLLPETRMVGPFFNLQYHANVWPNAFALFLLMTWPVFLLVGKKDQHWKISILVGIVISAILLTFSRGAIIVLGAQILMIFLYFASRLKPRHWLYAFISFIVAVAFFLDTI